MQDKLVNLLEQLNPKISDIEKVLGLNSGTLNTYTRTSQRRNMPEDVQIKIKKYLIAAANFVLSELGNDMYEKSTTINTAKKLKKSNNQKLIKDKNRYYPDGAGWVHFYLDDYYMTDQYELEINGKTYEFNPTSKIPGMLSEKYLPKTESLVNNPTTLLVLDENIHIYD